MNAIPRDDQAVELPAWALPTEAIVDIEQRLVTHVVDPDVDLPEATRRTLNARNITALVGQCPECGARMLRPNRAARRKAARLGGHLVVSVEHEDDCPAADQSVPQWHRYVGQVAG